MHTEIEDRASLLTVEMGGRRGRRAEQGGHAGRRRLSRVAALALRVAEREPLEPSAAVLGLVVVIVLALALGHAKALDVRKRHVAVHRLALRGRDARVERRCRRRRQRRLRGRGRPQALARE